LWLSISMNGTVLPSSRNCCKSRSDAIPGRRPSFGSQ
jgi:hypothetical protein